MPSFRFRYSAFCISFLRSLFRLTVATSAPGLLFPARPFPFAFALGSGYLACPFWTFQFASDLAYITAGIHFCQYQFFIFFDYYLVFRDWFTPVQLFRTVSADIRDSARSLHHNRPVISNFQPCALPYFKDRKKKHRISFEIRCFLCGAYDKLIQFSGVIQCNTWWYIATLPNILYRSLNQIVVLPSKYMVFRTILGRFPSECGMYIKLIQCSSFMHRNITCINFLHKNCIYHAFHFVEYFPYGYDAFCKYHSLYYTYTAIASAELYL